MKDQTSLIVIIVAGIFTVGAGIGLWITKREPVTLTAPTAVNLTAPALPAGQVSYTNGLAGSASSGGGRSAGGFAGFAGPGGPGGPGGAFGGAATRGRAGGGGKGGGGDD